MSDPKLISPLLDGYVMGAPMNSHDGVRCCPAMRENSENRYIVKVISIPASQVQLNALLLTGAYNDPAAAMDYFKSQADGIVEETVLLQKLAKLEGFLPYDGSQIVPMENNELGYHVYLISSYKRSLEKFMRRNPVTHLAAVNLGLDLCAALAICRNAGYLYLDLKPTNIFISEDKEYRIGDIGFVPLNSLKYSSMPKKYRSCYTAPELYDDMATINTTADTYAVGMILYQVYNNGVLPFTGKAPEEPLPTPLNADYEIAEIIMKAIAPNPDDRWKDPLEMGQALVGYMQRNVINDLPINPPLADLSTPAEAEAPVHDSVTQEEFPCETPSETSNESEQTSPSSDAPAEEPEKALPEELEFLETITSDETAPEESDAESLPPEEMTEEVSSMLEQADALIVHELPNPFEEALGESTQQIDIGDLQLDADDSDVSKTMVLPTGSPIPVSLPQLQEATETDAPTPQDEDMPPKKHKGLAVMLILLALLCALAVGAVFFYHNYYILKIDSIDVSSESDSVTMTVNTQIDTSLLTVICSDSYGNVKRTTLTGNQAVFTDLTPDTMYQIQLIAEGFHKLVGLDNTSFTTAAETKILDFSAITGTEDGSVVLDFTVEGPENEWNIIYSTEGEQEQTVSFSGHSVTITGLTVGNTYTFRLEPVNKLYMVGENTLSFTAARIVLAQDLKIISCQGGKLTATWSAPEDASVESWNVLCYGDDGYRQELTTSETSVIFEGVASGAYTVEVLAADMTQVVRASIKANPITITSVEADSSDPQSITVKWEFEGNAPEGGWQLLYSIDESDIQEVVRCDSNEAVIQPKIPNATYHLTFCTASDGTVFNETYSFTASDTTTLLNQGLNFITVNMRLLVTPSKSNWTYENVSSSAFTTSFHSGDSISILLNTSPVERYWIDHQDMNLLYVIRDENNNVLPQFTEQEVRDWYDMWWNTSTKNFHYLELDLPSAPTDPGTYTLELYFDGYTVGKVTFTVAA